MKQFKFLFKKINFINNSIIQSIKKNIKYKKIKRYKICLHKNEKEKVQEMLNFSNGFNYYRPHKHLNGVSESYHIIEGQMEIYIINSKCKVKKKIKLSAKSKNNYFIFKISTPEYHFVVPSSEWLIYHEVTTGPWNKKNLKYAEFSPKIDNLKEGYNFYKKMKLQSKNLKWIS